MRTSRSEGSQTGQVIAAFSLYSFIFIYSVLRSCDNVI